jgi:membrane protein
VANRVGLGKWLWTIPKRSIFQFMEDSAFCYSAAIAFYTMLSLAPLLIVLLGLTTTFVETRTVKSELVGQVESIAGKEAGRVIAAVIDNVESAPPGRGRTLLGVAILLLAATAVFAQLQAALNKVWGVETRPGLYVWSFLATRVVSFGMVLAVGFLLLMSVVVSAAIATISGHLAIQIPLGFRFWEFVDLGTTLFISTLLFLLVFRYIPDVRIAWEDILVGATITGVLFTLGKIFISQYLGRTSLSSVFGAAGSLVVMLFWIYYTSLIVLFGAEVGQVYTRLKGSSLVPRRFSRLVKQGK